MIQRLVKRVILVLGAVVTIAVALLAIGSAAGRWRVARAPSPVGHASTPNGSVVLVVPVPAATLHPGDEIIVTLPDRESPHTYFVSGVTDAHARAMRIQDERGRIFTGTLPNTVWRVRYAVPALGPIFGFLLGGIQAAVLVLLGLGLLWYAERGRHDRVEVAEPT
jgi:hypothetical protein